MNIELFEGQSCLVHVKLPAEWEVYGGTPKGEFKSERESSDSVLVTVPAMEADFTPLVPYELFARRILDGREWLVLSGQLHVRRRYSDAGGGISAIEYFVEPKLVEDGISSSPQIIVGIPGPQGPKGEKGDPGEGGMTAEERATLAGAAQRDGDNTFTSANTFTGSVDMSTASVTPPSGWNVGELTAEQVQAVAPIAWADELVKLGFNASANSLYSTALGARSTALHFGTAVGNSAYANIDAVATGMGAKAQGNQSTALGKHSKSTTAATAVGHFVESKAATAVTIGARFAETFDGQNVTHTCTTEGTGSITIGAGANTLNNGDTESSNSVTIGCKASNQGEDSVVIGAQAKGEGKTSVIIGSGAYALTNEGRNVIIGGSSRSPVGNSIVVGYDSFAKLHGSVILGNFASTLAGGAIAIGYGAVGGANGSKGVALGYYARTDAKWSNVIGYGARVSDLGATVIRSTAEDGTYTQLYFSGANTPLANTYHDGAPMLGYVTKDSAGNIVAAGTRSLIDLLTENSTFAPASLDENGEWVMPKVFHPSDLDMPVEEPSEVEEYQPLPVYPIVEPDDIMGDNGTLEQGDTENTSPETNS